MKWLDLLVDAFATEHFPDYDPDRMPSLVMLCDFDYGASSGLPTLTTHYPGQSLPRPFALEPLPARLSSSKELPYEC